LFGKDRIGREIKDGEEPGEELGFYLVWVSIGRLGQEWQGALNLVMSDALATAVSGGNSAVV